MKTLTIFAISILLSLNATAETVDSNPGHVGPYMGLGLGGTNINMGHIDVTSWHASVFGGYRFNSYLAAEIALSTGGIDDDDEGIKFDGTGTGFSLDILPMIPLTDNWDAFLKLGYRYVTTDVIATGYGGSNIEIESDDGGTVGVGFQWHSDEIFIRGGVGTSFGDSVRYGIDVGFKF